MARTSIKLKSKQNEGWCRFRICESINWLFLLFFHNWLIILTSTFFIVFFYYLLFTDESPVSWAIFTISIIILINYVYKKRWKKKVNLVDMTNSFTLVLTIVLISISIPLLHPRVELLSTGSPHAFYVTDNSVTAVRTFNFQITKPTIIIPSFKTYKSIKIANQIHDIRLNDPTSYGVISSTVDWIPDKEHNLLRFSSNSQDRGYDKEIFSLVLRTDFPFQYDESGKNLTHFYEYEKEKGTFCSWDIISITNYQNTSFRFEKNLTFFIAKNTTVYVRGPPEGNRNFIEEFFYDQNYNHGNFWINSECGSKLKVPEYSRLKTDKGLFVTFRHFGELSRENNQFYVVYYPGPL